MSNPVDPQQSDHTPAEGGTEPEFPETQQFSSDAVNEAVARSNEPIDEAPSAFESWFRSADEATDSVQTTTADDSTESTEPAAATQSWASSSEAAELADDVVDTQDPVADEVTVLTTAAAAGVAAAAAPVSAPVSAPASASETTVTQATTGSDPEATLFRSTELPPKPAGNRWFAAAVGLIGTVIFALLYFGLVYTVNASAGNVVDPLNLVGSPVFLTPVAAFFVGFAVLGAILNRAAWWAWAVFGLFVGVFSYLGFIIGMLIEMRIWEQTADVALTLLSQNWLNLYGVLVFVFAREIPVWLGGWIARRGRRLTQEHVVAMAQYRQDHPATLNTGSTDAVAEPESSDASI